MLKRLFSNWWFISIATCVALALLLTVGLPLFVGALRPMLIRIIILICLGILWLGWFLIRRFRAKKIEAALTEEIVQSDRPGEEAAALRSRMKDALKMLREANGSSRNYLYSRPWYVIIGPPGAGKTTALMNSGLRFPYSDQSQNAMSGTRNLDFLFADEAVLVDTAGRYTTQDSDSEVDEAGWFSLLKLLSKHRPYEPINGVFVAIAIEDLQRGDVQAIDQHAAIVRRRLYELSDRLGVDVPVYLLLTKSDKLAGFVEYFSDLDVDGRRSVFGHTFAPKIGRLNSSDFTTAFDAMTNDIAARSPKRLQEETDLRRRGLILGFPSQLHALRAPLHRFVTGAFFDEGRQTNSLRGFYLTSGMQDGSALDRIIDSVSDAYQVDHQGEGKAGRAYFLNRLLKDVSFQEAGLLVPDPKLERKRKTRQGFALASLGIASLALLLAWSFSFVNNRAFQKDTEIEIATVLDDMDMRRIDTVRVSQYDTPLDQIVTTLNALRDLPEGYAAREEGGPAISRRFGLFQSGLSRQNVEAYRGGLRRMMLPRIVLRLEDQIRRNMDDPIALYEPLKVYLMLGGSAPEGRIDEDAVRNYVERDWAMELYPGSEMRPVRDDLSRHLAALVEDRNISTAWLNGQAPLDATLVADARLSVSQLSLGQRAYAIMRERAADLEKDWLAASVLQSGDAQAFASPETVMELTVPYFFTRRGFQNAFSLNLPGAESAVMDELWVLGESEDNASVQREMGRVRTGVTNSYIAEYIEQWDRVVEAMKPADYFTDERAYRAFLSAPSPLKVILTEVRDNTTFEGGGASELGDMALDAAQRRSRVIRGAQRVAGASSSSGLSVDAQISNYFADINEWVGGPEDVAPIDDYLELVRTSFREVLISRDAGSQAVSRARLAQAMAPLEQAAFEVPELMTNFVAGVAKGGDQARATVLQGAAMSSYQNEVYPVCLAAVDGNYPFNASSRTDVELRNLRAAFGDGGSVTQFINNELDPYINRSGQFWSWKRDSEVARSMSPRSVMNFQKAIKLQDVFANGLPLRFKLVNIGYGISRVQLSTGGASLEFSPENAADQTIVWQLGGGVVRTSEIKIFGSEGELLWQHSEDGPWSLFRVLDVAKIRNNGQGAVVATFNAGPNMAAFEIAFPIDQDPFSGGGIWSVQCPSSL